MSLDVSWLRTLCAEGRVSGDPQGAPASYVSRGLIEIAETQNKTA
jgi:hypothetical protein